MDSPEAQIEALLQKSSTAPVKVFTLGRFGLLRDHLPVPDKAWGRDKTLQLFQFLVAARRRHALRKEQITDRLWEDDSDSADATFKVALHGVNKVLEPDRKNLAPPRFIIRQGLTYRLDTTAVWIDADIMESFIIIGNQHLTSHPETARRAYREAIALHQGVFLPDRIYEDWSCEERERLQVLALGAITTLAELELPDSPLESIRLAREALLIDTVWEDAWRIQIQAYIRKGNRPQALKTWQQCVKALHETLGIAPLPETKRVIQQLLDQ